MVGTFNFDIKLSELVYRYMDGLEYTSEEISSAVITYDPETDLVDIAGTLES